MNQAAERATTMARRQVKCTNKVHDVHRENTHDLAQPICHCACILDRSTGDAKHFIS